MTKIKENFLFYIILFCVAIIPSLFWFKNGHIIAGIDFFAPIFPLEIIKNSFNPLYIWSDTINAGTPSGLAVSKFFPYLSIWVIFEQLGFDIYTTQTLYFTIIFITIFSSMYFLVATVLPNINIYIKISSALFYAFHPYVSFWYSYLGDARIIAYAITPLILGIFIKGSKSSRQKLYIAFFLLCNTLLFSVSGNPPTWVIPWILIVIYSLYTIFIGENKYKLLKYLTTIFLLSFLINLWWIYSLYISLTTSGIELGENVSSLKYFISTSSNSSILNILNGLGKWSSDGGTNWFNQFYPYYPNVAIYKSTIFKFMAILLVIFASFGYFNNKNRQMFVFGILTVIIFIFLSKGSHFPFGGINIFLYEKVPGFWLFREPISYLLPGVIIGLSIMIASCKTKNNLVISTLIAIILIRGFSIFTGEIFPPKRGWMNSSHVKVPQFLFDIRKNLQDISDNRVLILPRSAYTYGNSNYWGYTGVDKTYYFIDNPYVLGVKNGHNTLGGYIKNDNLNISINNIYEYILNRKYNEVKHLFGIFNIRFLIYRHDYQYKYDLQPKHKHLWTMSPIEFQKFTLSNLDWLKHKERFGDWGIYEVQNNIFVPHISTANVIRTMKEKPSL